MRWLVEREDIRGMNWYFPFGEHIRDRILTGCRQAEGRKIDCVVSLLLRPVKDGQDALPTVFFEEKDAWLLILRSITHQVDRDRCSPQADHIDQFPILDQCETFVALP